jgi:hypothetical protein
MFPPINPTFASISIPASNNLVPALPPYIASAATGRKKPSKRPRANSSPLSFVQPARPIARGASASASLLEQPTLELDFLDALTTSALGPDPGLLEDASLDAIDDAMCEQEEEEGKKGKKRRWVARPKAERDKSEC